MEADFSGYATKAGLRCSDGVTIMPGAFKHQDQIKVPLVWQHGHQDPDNILGHAILEHREDGVYAYAYFNETPKATQAKALVKHGDITMLSIWANELIQKGKRVLHGAIREVSLVLSGANPGALIEPVTIRHGEDQEFELEDEAIIHTGIPIEHESPVVKKEEVVSKKEVIHAEDDEGNDDDEETIEEVYNSMSEKQQTVLHFMLGEALASTKEDGEEAKHDNINKEGSNDMTRNVFEKEAPAPQAPVLSHSDIQGIVADATKLGSLKDAVEGYAIQHGITDIDILFPDAQSISNVPEFLARRTEWVNKLLSGTRKSPFSRVKTMSADITESEARAKGYIKGNLKKEEFFGVSKRVTTPTTVYKKQKLDRDDMIDITDFDVVMWLKGEMRLMLDEEIARAILVGDGRDIAHDDKISESNIRPIATDHELFTTQVYVNIDDANSSIQEVIDAIVENRKFLKGTGLPTMYTTETIIAKFLLLKDAVGRRIYKSLDEVSSELRVAEIVPVEVLEEYDDTICILVNPTDYVLGADKGGNVSMFDDFDIDYNQYKYLIETRLSGALVRLKAAMHVMKVAASSVLVVPAEPAFDGEEITITNQTGVVYKNMADDSVMNAAGSPYEVPEGESVTVYATPASGYYFPTSENDTWTFTNS